MLKIARAYEKINGNGKRILVDRLWPRGVTKEAAAIDAWLKDLAPSDALRTWFGHEPEKFSEFRRKYILELSTPEKRALLKQIAEMAETGDVTLIYAAKDTEHNNAVVLSEVIGKLMKQKVHA